MLQSKGAWRTRRSLGQGARPAMRVVYRPMRSRARYGILHTIQARLPSAWGRWQADWQHMLPLATGLLGLFWLGHVWHWDQSVLAAVTFLIALLSGLLLWLVGVIALLPIIGPLIVKVLSLSVIWLLNAVGYLLSYIAIRRGYSRDVLTYRGLTIALIVGIVVGFVLAKLI